MAGTIAVVQRQERMYPRYLAQSAPPSPLLSATSVRPSFLKTNSLSPRPRPKLHQPCLPPPPFEVVYSGSVLQVMKEQLEQIDLEGCEPNGENAFFVCDLASVYRANERWTKAFNSAPEVSAPIEPFYGEQPLLFTVRT